MSPPLLLYREVSQFTVLSVSDAVGCAVLLPFSERVQVGSRGCSLKG